jgi:hypothetical protein
VLPHFDAPAFRIGSNPVVRTEPVPELPRERPCDAEIECLKRTMTGSDGRPSSRFVESIRKEWRAREVSNPSAPGSPLIHAERVRAGECRRTDAAAQKAQDLQKPAIGCGGGSQRQNAERPHTTQDASRRHLYASSTDVPTAIDRIRRQSDGFPRLPPVAACRRLRQGASSQASPARQAPVKN